MKVIYKYELPQKIIAECWDGFEKVFKIELPKYCEILSVQVQDEKLVMWAKVNPGEEKEEASFIWIMTGTQIESSTDACLDYITTIMGGDFVFHLFQIKNPMHKFTNNLFQSFGV